LSAASSIDGTSVAPASGPPRNVEGIDFGTGWSLKQTLECAECGFEDYRALEFHHPDGQEKDFAIGQMLVDNRSIRAVQREIAKCVVLCANCHRIEHFSDEE
jgi:hypothetical protein